MSATVFFCLRNSACALLCLFSGAHFWGYRRMWKDGADPFCELDSHTPSLPQWGIGILRELLIRWMIGGNWWQGEEPDVQSQWKNQELWPKNSTVLSADRLLPEGSGSHTLWDHAHRPVGTMPVAFIYLSCRQIQQLFEKVAPTNTDKPRDQEAPCGSSSPLKAPAS